MNFKTQALRLMTKISVYSAVVVLLPTISNAQAIKVGIKAGLFQSASLESGIGSTYMFARSNYVLGPQLEISLPRRFAIEADALYSAASYSKPISNNVAHERLVEHNWVFPVLAKRYLGSETRHRSFIAGGMSFRSILGIVDLAAGRAIDVNSRGIVVSSGTEFRLRSIVIAPEVRFTHWGSTTIRDGLELAIGSRKNQPQLLLGISF
jgi:hypothetical protein